MSLRTIRELGDPVLEKKAKAVKEMTPKIRQLIEDMKETMYDADGVGLAAPQVGMLKRIVVIDVSMEQDQPIVLINPEIVEQDGEQTGWEGCLSVPGKSGQVTRPQHVVAKAPNEDMEEFTIEGTDLLARAICHELDHLEGHMYVELVEGKLYTNEELDEMAAKEEEEAAVREAVVRRFPRESFLLADKLPILRVREAVDYPRFFEEQLERCGVDYFDRYLLHNLGRDRYVNTEKFGAFDFLSRMKEQGRIRQFGFSFHDNAQTLDRILTDHPEVDFVQLQINYLDWNSAVARAMRPLCGTGKRSWSWNPSRAARWQGSRRRPCRRSRHSMQTVRRRSARRPRPWPSGTPLPWSTCPWCSAA